jgi:valine dehydrogenase (NAD+)
MLRVKIMHTKQIQIIEIKKKGYDTIIQFKTDICRGFVAIHNISIGDATGGTRYWKYNSEQEALQDALDLSKAMTYKYGLTNIHFGGGKAVILDEGRDKAEVMKEYGRILNEINKVLKKKYGRVFTTGEDAGITLQDVNNILQTCNREYINGSELGSGDPSPITAFYVKEGMKVCALRKYGTPTLNGKKIFIQGIGKVGMALLKLLEKETTDIVVCDVNKQALDKIRLSHPWIKVLDANDKEAILKEKCDIFSPCALSHTVTKELLDKLKCSIVCGSANAPLESPELEEYMHKKRILYAPDFCVNAAGALQIGVEIICRNENRPYDELFVKSELNQIAIRLNQLFDLSEKMNSSPAKVGRELVESKLALLGHMNGKLPPFT